jgi:hypothetical protein
LWIEKVVPKILNVYSSNSIYNLDETAVFYKAMPNKSYFVKGKYNHGIKKFKQRFTALICVNMIGEKLKPLIIGKSTLPRSFPKFYKPSSFMYESQNNSWLTSPIFLKYILYLNAYFKSNNRFVAMILDNCTSHNIDTSLISNIQFFFLPANTTAIGQPLDAGFIILIKH